MLGGSELVPALGKLPGHVAPASAPLRSSLAKVPSKETSPAGRMWSGGCHSTPRRTCRLSRASRAHPGRHTVGPHRCTQVELNEPERERRYILSGFLQAAEGAPSRLLTPSLESWADPRPGLSKPSTQQVPALATPPSSSSQLPALTAQGRCRLLQGAVPDSHSLCGAWPIAVSSSALTCPLLVTGTAQIVHPQ